MSLKLYHGILFTEGGTDEKGGDILAAVDIRQGNPTPPKALSMNEHGGRAPSILTPGIHSQDFQGI